MADMGKWLLILPTTKPENSIYFHKSKILYFIFTLNKAHNNTVNKTNDTKNVYLVTFAIGCKSKNPLLLFMYNVCLRVVFLWGYIAIAFAATMSWAG